MSPCCAKLDNNRARQRPGRADNAAAMKASTLAVFALCSAASLAFAGFKVPKNIHTPETLEAAKTEAANEKKGIAILYSNPGTT